MGVFGKFKDLIGIEEVPEEELLEKEVEEAQKKLESEKKPVEAPAPKPSVSANTPSGRMTMNTNTSPFKMVVIEPESFDECPRLVDSLKCRKPVIINLEKIDGDTAHKIFDFISGATYALNGNIQKVANNIFIFAPENVDISASVEHKGFDFSMKTNANFWNK